MPPAKSLGVVDVVISASQGSLLQTAKKQGYRVYVEVDPERANAEAKASSKMGLSGLIIGYAAGPEGSTSTPAAQDGSAEALIKRLRSAYPSLDVRLLQPGGKQPQMRGTMVLGKNRVFQVSSATHQPWIDSNVALIRFERAYDPGEKPLFDFKWDLVDSVEQRYGPPPEAYELAVAEAGAFHADVILPLHRHFQDGLAEGKPQAWKAWSGILRTIRFCAQDSDHSGQVDHLVANVGVFTGDYANSYEEVNLMARHNIPYRVLPPRELTADHLHGMAMIVVFSPLDRAAEDAVQQVAENGGAAVLVGQQGNFPWHTSPPARKNDESAVYKVGSGKIVEVSTPILNPEPFAKDVWRLLSPPDRELTLWNALTTLAAAYETKDASTVQINLVNYSLTPLRVQARVKGTFSRIRVATPGRGCCVSLAPVVSDGFTGFVVPEFRVGARVDLSNVGLR
ncbi:MAG: hypothetical protein ACRD11_04150 [Terriglobia bacterium]